MVKGFCRNCYVYEGRALVCGWCVDCIAAWVKGALTAAALAAGAEFGPKAWLIVRGLMR